MDWSLLNFDDGLDFIYDELARARIITLDNQRLADFSPRCEEE